MRRKPVLFCVILLVFAGCTAAPNSELQGSTALTYSAAAGGSGAPVTPYGDTLNATTDGNTVRLAAVLGRHDPRARPW